MFNTDASERFEQQLLKIKINSKSILWFSVHYKHTYVIQEILSLFLFEKQKSKMANSMITVSFSSNFTWKTLHFNSGEQNWHLSQ